MAGGEKLIKKSQYVQLTLLIVFIFVLFMMTATSISYQSNIDSSDPEKVEKMTASAVEQEESEATGSAVTLSGREDVVVIQGDNSVGAKNISSELTLLKKEFVCYKTMDEVPIGIKERMNALILCSSKIEGYYSYDDIVSASKQGTDIIFAILPSDGLTEEWVSLLGIRYLGKRYTQKGIVTFGNFMIGGIRWYEDYRIRVRRVKVESSCKTYVAGIIEEEKQDVMDNEDATDIIWRTVFGKSRIFVVNGNFFTDTSHMGILNAIFSRMNSDYVYPIVNAKMLFVENAPCLSEENKKEMQKRYARNSERFLEEIAIPGIVSLAMELEIQPQFYGTQYLKTDSGGIQTESASFLSKELTKIGGDIQVCAYQNDTSRMIKSIDIFEEVTGKNVTSILLQNNNSRMEREIMTAISYKEGISSIIHNWKYYPYMKTDENNYVYIPMMTEGYEMDDELQVWFDEAAASLGLITHGIDMEEIIYPDTKDDWSMVFKDFSAYFYTACQKYDYLDGVDGEEMDQRVRQYLMMEPEVTYEKKKITLKVENLFTKGYFILQTEKTIKKMSSGKYKKLEDGSYLLTITDPETEITLKEE
jgi:hypothetical protein